MKYFCRVGKSNQIADSTIGKNAGIYVWKMEGELFQLFTCQGIAEKCGRCLPYFAYLIKCNPGSRQCNFPTYLCPSINSCELVWKTAGKTNRPPWKTLWKWLTKGQSVRRAGKLALLQWNKLQISGGNWKFIGKGEEVWCMVFLPFYDNTLISYIFSMNPLGDSEKESGDWWSLLSGYKVTTFCVAIGGRNFSYFSCPLGGIKN